LNLDDFTNAGESGKITVDVKPVPPPVKVTLKRVRKLYQVKEKAPAKGIDFKLDKIDYAKYTITETKTDIEHLDKDNVPKLNRNDVKEQRSFSEITLVAEIARYLNKSCLLIRSILADSKDGIPALLAKINEFNELLYDHVIPQLFKELYDIAEFDHHEEHTLELVKVPENGEPFKFNAKKDLLASLGAPEYSPFKNKSFHLDNYCFDSKPERDLFWNMLHDGMNEMLGWEEHEAEDFENKEVCEFSANVEMYTYEQYKRRLAMGRKLDKEKLSETLKQNKRRKRIKAFFAKLFGKKKKPTDNK
jgi:hypothetical protein